MTLPSENKRNQYVADGVQTVFPYSFRIIQAQDVIVVLSQPITNVDTTQILGVNYTVTNVNVPGGGNIVFNVAPANGFRVTIARDAEALQLEQYVENDPFPAASHELALDRLTTIAQTTLEQTSRSLQVPYGTDMGVYNSIMPPLNPTVAGYSVTVKTDLSGFEYTDVSAGIGGGDVTGPGSSTANAIAKFAGTDGSLIANTSVLITGAGNNIVEVRPQASVGEVRFYELAANGTNYVALRAPNSKVGDNTYILPASDGASGTVLTTDGSGNLSWQVAGSSSGINWSVITSPTAMTANSGYITNNALALQVSLPASASVGHTFEITNINGGFIVVQNAGQRIRHGDVLTTLGVTGTLTGIELGDSVKIICVQANTLFQVVSSQGNITLL